MFKKLMIVVILAIAGVAGVAYYYWQQATSLPSWYQKSAENITKIQELPPAIIDKKTGGQVKLDGEQLNQFIGHKLAQDSKLRQVLPSTKAIHSDIKDGKLQIGAVVNTSKLLETNLSAQERVVVDQLIQKIPQLQNRDIYVGVQGTPQLKDGKLVLGKDSQIKVGNLSFTPAQIAARLNLPVERVEQELALNVQKLNLKDIKLNQGEMELKFKQ